MPRDQHVLEATFRVDNRRSRTANFKEPRVYVQGLVVSCPVCGAPNSKGPIVPPFGKLAEEDGTITFSEPEEVVAAVSRTDFGTVRYNRIAARACRKCGVVFTITEGVVLELQALARDQVPKQPRKAG